MQDSPEMQVLSEAVSLAQAPAAATMPAHALVPSQPVPGRVGSNFGGEGSP